MKDVRSNHINKHHILHRFCLKPNQAFELRGRCCIKRQKKQQQGLERKVRLITRGWCSVADGEELDCIYG